MAPLKILEETNGGILVVAPAGRIDAVTSDEIERRLLGLATAGARLVVDLQAVEYISSAGLRVLLRLAKKVKEQSGRVVLCSLGPAVHQVFELAGFLALFEIEPDRGSAVARLSGPGSA
ncbi:MAG TPA: STAS domain-containing protein [Vicinamibacteria bacterium]|nr:STAS domain-containing protein [Vicinamibacteria bacterium]